ncbi:MAG TPA: hypothetical protein VL200_10340 [Lacunisphaera sp.]|jgi:hypothetical protein|nr:hypothetical protein [Lacunisphaera sp.]
MNHAETMITATLILALLVVLVATDAAEPGDDARPRADRDLFPQMNVGRGSFPACRALFADVSGAKPHLQAFAAGSRSRPAAASR